MSNGETRILLGRLLAVAGTVLIAACIFDTRYAGTSSGVDNPSLILGFRDGNGAPVTLTGTLSLYAVDQNPALDPDALATLKIESSDSISLLATDVTRGAALAKSGAWDNGDSVVSFNLFVKGDSGSGLLVAGLSYNPALKKFSAQNGDSLHALEVHPRPLLRYQASLARPDGATDTGKTFGRVFIPGTPFRAVLVDSVFVFPELPQGIFPLRMLAEDGRVFVVRESLDTKTAGNFTASSTPIFRLPPDPSIPLFQISVGPDREVFLSASNFLQAKITGVEATDGRLTFLWKQIRERNDTAAHAALIVSPTTLQTEVKFPAEGVYRFAMAATMGLRTLRDTLLISVRKTPIATPRIIQPRPGEIVKLGQEYRIAWEMPDSGAVNIQFTLDSGVEWKTLVEHYVGPGNLNLFAWTPGLDLGPSRACLIRVISVLNPAVAAKTEGPFFLVEP